MLNDRSSYTVSQLQCPQSMPGPDQMDRGQWQPFGENSQISDVESSVIRPLSQSPSFLPSPAMGDSRGGLNSVDSDVGLPAKSPRISSGSNTTPTLSSTNSIHAFQRSSQAPTPTEELTRLPNTTLVLRNLPRTTTALEIQSLVSPFIRSSVPSVQAQFSANQALVQFGTAAEAHEAHRFLKAHPTSLGGNIVQASFSNCPATSSTDEKFGSTKVLLTTVTNLMYPVNIELLKFLFSRFGNVQKIISFSKTTSPFQALIQMENPIQAQAALTNLHSRNIYDGCNTLQIQPSRMRELNVKVNNTKAWDYTTAPEGVPPTALMEEQMSPAGSKPAGFGGGPFFPSQNFVRNGYAENRPPPNGNSPITNSLRFSSPGFLKISSLQRLPREVREWKNSLQTLTTSPTPVLIVYNLTVDKVTVNELFNAFSLYGILQRIKILREKPHTALIQYSDPVFSALAAHFLHGAALFDEEIGLQINFSKNPEVKLSNGVGGVINDKKTKAFQNHDQRYGFSQPQEIDKFIRSICSPTKTLFIANLREGCDVEQVFAQIRNYGRIVKTVTKMPSQDGQRKKYVLVEMVSPAEAMKALVYLHNSTIGDSVLKVAFSKLLISEEVTAESWSNSSHRPNTLQTSPGSSPLAASALVEASQTTSD